MKRNPNYIIEQLYESKSNMLFTKKDCIIQFPKRYTERGMAEISVNNYVFGVLALIMDGQYSVMLIPAMIKTTPSRISEVMIGDVPYMNFHYLAGSAIMDTTLVQRKNTLVYNIMEEFFLKGNIPWYVDYEDLGKIFDKAKDYADSNVAKNYAVMECLAAYISRSPKDRAIYYRLSKDYQQSPEYIGMYGNVYYAAPGTVNKLAGSYFQDAIVSALVQPSERISHVEQLLRE